MRPSKPKTPAANPKLQGTVTFVLLLLAGALPAEATVYSYENTTGGPIPYSGTNTGCNSGGLAVDFVVPASDNFLVTNVGLGLNITHPDRNDIRAILNSPGGAAQVVVLSQEGGGDDASPDNYDIYLANDADNEGPVSDGDDDPIGEPYYFRLVNLDALSSAFDGITASGTWTLRVCRRFDNDFGTLHRAQLVLESAVTTTTARCANPTTLNWGSFSDRTVFLNTTVNGITVTRTEALDFGGDGDNGAAGPGNFVTRTDTLGNEAGYYSLYMDAGGSNGNGDDSETVGQRVRFSFSVPSARLQFTLSDIDWFNNPPNTYDFEDQVRVYGTSPSGSRVPYVISGVGDRIEVVGDMLEGNDGDSGTLETRGSATITFDGPVSAVSIEYTQGDEPDEGADDQRIGIGDLTFCGFDYGDAPTSYGTAARHAMGVTTLHLGAQPGDGEGAQQTGGSAATADDVDSGLTDDEDGVPIPFPAMTALAGGTYTVPGITVHNTSGAAATLCGWVDFDINGGAQDGSFQTDEGSCITVPASGNNPDCTESPAGTFTCSLTWTVPADFVRTQSNTYARFRVTPASAGMTTTSFNTAIDQAGEVEDYEITAGTLPVTLAWVKSEIVGGEVVVQFATATESLNAGFRLWGVDGRGERTLLGNVMSETPDTFVPQIYEARVPAKGIVALEIEDLALAGRNRLHGPFEIGGEAGEEPVADAIDWASIKAEGRVAGPLDSFAPARHAFVEDAKKRPVGYGGGAGQGLLLVREEGIHRVTHEDLVAAGVDLTGVPVAQIALKNDGVGIARHVESESAVFGPGAYIEFVARPVPTLASPVDAYVLAVDAAHARQVATMGTRPASLAVTSAEDVYRPDREYTYASPTRDPWYDQRLLAWGSAATLTRSFDLPDFAGGDVELDFAAFGYRDAAGASPDHHIVVRVNGTEVLDERFDGIVPLERTLDVGDLVSAGGNVLEVQLPGDTGYDFDHAVFEGFTVRYLRQTLARGGRFHGTVATPFAIGGFAGDGGPVSIWRLQGAITHRSTPPPIDGKVSSLGGGTVYAAQESALLRPGIVAGVPAALQASTAEYLIVTHPALAGAMGDLVGLQQSRGFDTEVVTVDRIFAAYSDHASSAEAVRSFLAASYGSGNLRYVLLVGADTTDPYDHLGLGSISYVPTAYLPYAEPITYSPTDEHLVDFDGDDVGEVPVGRLPVRTAAELDAVVEKLYDWEQRAGAGLRTALFSAGASDSERATADLNEAYAGSLAGWSAGLAQVDDLGVAAARAAVLGSLNSGTPLVSYVGHSSMGQWDFTPLFRWQDIAGLTNAGAPSLITQWGCWNSYYVEPNIESLSARLLRQPDAGAAATIGAMTLTTDSAHRELGNLFFARVGAGAPTVGDALLGAKRDLAAQGWGRDALLGMALLGDPAMSLPAVE